MSDYEGDMAAAHHVRQKIRELHDAIVCAQKAGLVVRINQEMLANALLGIKEPGQIKTFLPVTFISILREL